MTTTRESSRVMAVAVRASSSRNRAISPNREGGLSRARTFLRPSTVVEISTIPSVSR